MVGNALYSIYFQSMTYKNMTYFINEQYIKNVTFVFVLFVSFVIHKGVDFFPE